MGFTSPPVSGTTMKNYVPGMNLKWAIVEIIII